jgi:DNA-binding CsgD family transcriptional regulator
MRVYGGEPRLALDDALMVASCGDDAISHRGMAIASVALALLGRTDEAVRMAQQGLEVHRRCSDRTQSPESQYIGSVLAHLGAGRLASADTEATIGYEAALSAGDHDGLATFCLLAGMVHVDQGRLSEAKKRFLEGRALNEELRDPGTLRWCCGGVALAEGMSGLPSAALAAAELDELPRHWLSSLDADLVDRGRAWAKVATGEISTARAILREAAVRAAAQDSFVAEARLLHDVARLGDSASVAGRLLELSEVVDGEVALLFADHANAGARGSRTDLEAVAERFEDLGALLVAAEVCCEASAACRQEGLLRRATTWDHRAEVLSRRCGDVRTPGLLVAGEAGRLTRREREVAELAASGVGSSDIADRLFLSVRTVENHLQHVYTKLGVTGREQLEPALGTPRAVRTS